jgi:GTPase
MTTTPSDRPAAILVAVQLPGVSDDEHAADLAELARLVHTLGCDVVGRLTQKRPALSQVALLGRGKLAELAALTGGTGVVPSGAAVKKDKARLRRTAAAVEAEDEAVEEPVDSQPTTVVERRPTVVVVDHDITPSQLKNLERATDAEVLDRTGVIVEIFHRHAKSREARIEVEIARLSYLAPRLRETGGGADRQRGGIGGRGAGETAVELDRRKIRDRIASLRQELASIVEEGAVRRARRRDYRRVVLVGYTNAGKSSLMRGLTASDPLVADQLFATLDTTVRALQPESHPRILVSDTVGFIKKLPHDLVASFRSTLDEAIEAGLLLHVADAADPSFRSQLAVTRSVLGEIGALDIPSRLLLNKVDKLHDSTRAALLEEFPEAVLLSAKSPSDIAALRQTIIGFFEASMVEGLLVVPYDRQHLLTEVHEAARVLSETYDELGARLRVLAHPAALARLADLLACDAR